MMEELGGRAVAVKCDVTCEEDVKSTLNRTVQAFGRLDVPFNNAGIEENIGTTADTEVKEWDRIINTDLRGTFLCLKYEIPLMLKQGAAGIVNTSSGAVIVGFKGIPLTLPANME
jgi:NAD(P)-dependent dehydrogenase (short-subunit alcohol dehydrogenase family)